MFKNTIKGIVVSASMFAVAMVVKPNTVYAGCESNYGGGETCIYNKSFEIEKKVRIEGENNWKDKVVDVEEGDVVEFRIKVKNVGEVGVDDMKYDDMLPDELKRVGGSGLTEEWDGFDPGEEKTFVIKTEIDEDEFDENFDLKCVVNKVELFYKDAFEGSDTATVCYGESDEEITELPETGPTATVGLALSGMALIAAGTLVKKGKLSR